MCVSLSTPQNFIEVKKGIDLIEAIYAEFKCNILFTTRNVFSYDDIVKLSNINKTMKKDFKYLFACVSISAYNSYKKLESCNLIPSPQKRIDFIKLNIKNWQRNMDKLKKNWKQI